MAEDLMNISLSRLADLKFIIQGDDGTVLGGLGEKGKKNQQYSPFGYSRRIEKNCPGTAFLGQCRERLTGLYLLGNGYRAFSPLLMRFMSADSWSPFGKGGLNAYAYPGADPVNQRDPTGHAPAFRYSGPARKLADNVIMFTDDIEGFMRLNIDAHGNAGILAFGRKRLSGSQVVEEFKIQDVELKKFHQLHLIVCHSADLPMSGLPSLAEEIANTAKLPVAAYKGIVFATNNTTVKVKGGLALDGYRVDSRNPFKSSHKSFGQFNYDPVLVEPSATVLATAKRVRGRR
jgi:RHS repeat-associated protein